MHPKHVARVLVAACGALSAAAASVTTVYRFPNGTWVENLAVRQNGGILATLVTSPNVIYLDPFAAKPSPRTIATFPSPDTAVTGITETSQDIFYASAVRINVSNKSEPIGNNTVWRLDLRRFDVKGSAVVTKIADVPQAVLLNGMTKSATGKLLMADSDGGRIFRLDPATAKIDLVSDDAALKLPATPCNANRNGVNGVQARDGSLFFSNTGACSYGRLPIDADGTVNGPAEILFQNNQVAPDDFALTPFLGPRSAVLAGGVYNNLAAVDGTGSSAYSIIANVSGPTSARMGRRAGDTRTLYISTSGGDDQYGKQPIPVGGSILRLKL